MAMGLGRLTASNSLPSFILKALAIFKLGAGRFHGRQALFIKPKALWRGSSQVNNVDTSPIGITVGLSLNRIGIYGNLLSERKSGISGEMGKPPCTLNIVERNEAAIRTEIAENCHTR